MGYMDHYWAVKYSHSVGLYYMENKKTKLFLTRKDAQKKAITLKKKTEVVKVLTYEYHR